MTKIINSTVAILGQDGLNYDINPPFDPPTIYPEYPFSKIDEKNKVYDAVRSLLYTLNLDKSNFGSKNWNPFKDLISPGDTVLIKPNFVVDTKFSTKHNFQGAVTHSSILRPLIDYAFIASNGESEIIVADGSIDITDFEDVVQATGCKEMIINLNDREGTDVKLFDLRYRLLKRKLFCNFLGFEIGIWKWEKNQDFPGFRKVDLKECSMFEEFHDYTVLRSTQLMSDNSTPRSFHDIGKHEYGISKIALDADVIINVPKLKTHKKAGNTLSLKNMIGVTVPRNWMPHYEEKKEFTDNIEGNISLIKKLWQIPWIKDCGGILIRNKKRKIEIPIGGSHPQNDVLWRSIIDINKILFYSNKNGDINKEKQRKFFTVIDGVFGGEGDAPLSPKVKKTGVLLGGFDPVSIDLVTTQLMGFDYHKLPYLNNLSKNDNDLKLGNNNISDITILKTGLKKESYHFEPAPTWKDVLD